MGDSFPFSVVKGPCLRSNTPSSIFFLLNLELKPLGLPELLLKLRSSCT